MKEISSKIAALYDDHGEDIINEPASSNEYDEIM